MGCKAKQPREQGAEMGVRGEGEGRRVIGQNAKEPVGLDVGWVTHSDT